jgi:hypothetical protein
LFHASTELVPDMDKDYGDRLNFIDERIYNKKIIEMINNNNPKVGQSLVG